MGRPTSQERLHLADLSARLGHRYVELSPDPAPAVRLRLELEQARQHGLCFDDVWLEAVKLAVASISIRDSTNVAQWRRAFMELEPAWRAAYDRTGSSVSPLRASLLAA